MRPRILHVIDHTGSGGAQVVVRYLIQALVQDFDFSVAVLGKTGPFSETFRALGVPVFELGHGHGRWSPLPMARLLATLRREPCDLLHSHLLKSSIAATLCGRWTDHRTIIHDHTGIYPQSLRHRSYLSSDLLLKSYLRAYKFALNRTDYIIVLTPQMLRMYKQFYSISPHQIAIVPNAVDVRTVVQREKPAMTLHQELGLLPETKIVMTVGRLEPEKGGLTLLQVAQHVQQHSDLPCAFVIVGLGSHERTLREYVATNQIESIFFLGYRDDVRFLLHHGDVFLLTSQWESFGIVILEAMAEGCPVVATRSGGPDSILTDGVDGFLAPVGDVQGLSNHVVNLLHDEELARRLAGNARETVASRYGVETIAAQMATIYQGVLKQ